MPDPALTRFAVQQHHRARKAETMPLFLDVHTIDGDITMADVAHAHAADLQVQDTHAVHYLKYWVDVANSKIFCLVDAPDAEAAATVHREAHGLVANEIFQVQEGS